MRPLREGKITQRMLFGAIALMIVSSVIAGFGSQHQFNTMVSSRQWVLHTQDVLIHLERLDAAVHRADDRAASAESRKLRELVKDNPVQAMRIAALQKLIDADTNPNDFDRLLSEFRAEEERLFKVRQEKLQSEGSKMLWAVSLLSVFALVFQVMMLSMVAYSFRQGTRANAQLSALLGSMAEGVYQLNAEGICTFVNASAERMLGYKESEIYGKNLHDLIHHTAQDGSPRPEEDCQLLKVISKNQPYATSDDVFVRKDGSFLPVDVTAQPLVENNVVVGAVVCFKDATERREVERRLSEFYSTVSHELRTPLTSIRAALGMIEGGVVGKLTERGDKLVGIARNECDRLIRLINDILDIKKIEAGKLELNLANQEPRDLVDRAIEGVHSMAQSARVYLKASVETNRIVNADGDRIRQVLVNLLSNAIKYSAAESTVVVSAVNSGEMIRFSVRDTGAGIPEDMIPKMFGMFQQADSSDSRAKGGTGLGLAISKSIITEHGGDIGISSQQGSGTTVWFDLPAMSRPTPSSGYMKFSPQATVLIVEDDAAFSALLVEQIQTLPVSVIEAHDGGTAIDIARHQSPDLIILDVGLPGLDGFEVIRILRDESSTKDISVVVYTARDMTASDRERLSLGKTHFYTKSSTTEQQFISSVKELLNGLIVGKIKEP